MIDVNALECSTKEMAAMLSIHPRSLQKLAQEGWIEGRTGHNTWRLAQTVQSYTSHLTHQNISGARR
jgi:hypothetical protein